MRTSVAPFRLVRATAVTLTILALAAGAHVSAGGSLPAAPILLALSLLTLLPVAILSGRRRTTPTVLAMLGGGQLALHQGFASLSPHMHCAGISGHIHRLDQLTLDCSPAVHQMPALDSGPGLLMLAAHIAATIITAGALTRGESAFWTMAAWLCPLLALPAITIPAPSSRLVPPVTTPPAISRWHGLRLPSLRGPPAHVLSA